MAAHAARKMTETIANERMNFLLPTDSVVFAVIARAAPQRAVRAIDHDGVDRSGRAVLEHFRVAHPAQFAADPRWRLAVQQNAPGLDLMVSERAPHLEAVDVGRLGRFLDRHSELDD